MSHLLWIAALPLGFSSYCLIALMGIEQSRRKALILVPSALAQEGLTDEK